VRRLKMKKRVFGALLFVVLGGCGDACYHRKVVGKVVGDVGSRFKGGAEGSGTEKFALRLDPYTCDAKVKEVAAGADGLYVECESTRCAILKDGQCVQLICGREDRLSEPDIVGCKLEKTIDCAQVVK
jgi:hypothetical protein